MTESASDNVLLEWYEHYIGTPDQETDVYVGFALFFGGIGLALAGIATFLGSAASGGSDAFVYALREFAAVAGAVGLPLLLLGVTVLLPVDRRVMYVAVGGLAICLVGVVLFVDAYPVSWNVPNPRDVSAQVVAVYAVGIVGVVAATGAALVGHQVERRTATGEPVDESADATATESVSDEQVRRDIDAAMADSNLSWGGVEKTQTKRLELDTSAVDDIDRSGFENAEATTTRASGKNVDDAVAGLRQLQGGEKETDSGAGTDDQAAALAELRQKQRVEAEAEPDGLAERLRDLFR